MASGINGEDVENDKVVVSLSPGVMSIRSEGIGGKLRAEVDMAYKGPPMEFRIKSASLAALIQTHVRCEVTPDHLIVRGEHWKYVTALGRVRSDVAERVEEVEDYEDASDE